MTAFIAQVVASEWWAPISQLGVAGSMLYWLAARVENRMKAMEAAVDRMAKAALLQILSFEQKESTIRSQAKALMDEIESKQANH
jgi:hypothetical protein